jgi:outer membrane protein W
MRAVTLVAVLMLLFSAVAFAQEKPTAVYVFVTNPGVVHSQNVGTRWEGSFGIALQRMFAQRWSAEVAVSQQSRLRGFTTFNPDGSVIESRVFTETTLPVDVSARYHFHTQGAWKPYAGLGMRWIEGTTSAGVTGGVVWQFHRTLGLRFDGRVLIGNDSRFDDTINGSVGLSWRF